MIIDGLKVFDDQGKIYLDMSVDVKDKEWLTVLGSSASGKSMLMKFISGSISENLNFEVKKYQPPKEVFYIPQIENKWFIHFSGNELVEEINSWSDHKLKNVIERADLILLDEPEKNNRINQRLSEFIHNGKRVICATHNMELALNHSTRIMVLKEGKVYGDYSRKEFLASEDEFIKHIIIYGL